MRLPLIGGSYTTRSIIASAQRCINLYPELNPKGNYVPLTHYQRPGLNPITRVGNGPIRGLYRASNGVGYVASGNQLFYFNSNFNSTFLGTLNTSNDQVSMQDNGTTLMVVDGSTGGYQVDLGTQVFSAISDPTNTFIGANQVQYVDTFLIWNFPGSIFFGSTLSNVLQFNGQYVAGKAGYPDNLKAIYVNRREIFLFGDLKSEVWYNSGGSTITPFPFQDLPGTYIEHGIAAAWSRASHDIDVFWLSRDLQGEGVVLKFRGYLTQRISNHALEESIRQMQKTVGIDDAIGMTYQLDGHTFYMLTFPRGNETWVYDSAIQDPNAAWHQECWTNPNTGSLDRSRINCMAFINGQLVAGDWQTNVVYGLDMDLYVDRVALTDASDYVDCPIVCIRSFPHIGAARAAGGNQGMEVDGHRLQFSAFRADMECGMGPLDAAGQPAKVSLRWSDDRGRTFGNALLQEAGAPGEYLTQPQWLGMGVARDRIFELSYNIAGPAALNGAWIDAEVLST